MKERRSPLLGLAGGALALIVVVAVIGALAMERPKASASEPDETGPVETLPDETAPAEAPILEEEPLTLEEIHQVSFTDVKTDDAAYDAVCYVASQAIMQGVGGSRFDPDGLVTRAEVAALLQRMGSDMSEPEETLTAFPDVSADDWYADAVSWAVREGIITGNPDGTFAPARTVTRTELAVMLYRFADSQGAELVCSGDLSAYSDGGTVAAYAVSPLSWALEQGLLDCMVTDTIHGQLPVSREQCAQALVALTAAVRGEPLAAELAAQDSLEPVVSASLVSHSQIQTVVDAAASKYGAVGVQVAVIEDGQVTDTFASGWATQGVDKMTADHKMRIASISKVLIGMEAMLLREQGVIDLDASIGTYWGATMRNPRYPDSPVTIRNLLNHTSSIIVAGDDVSRSYSSVRARLTGSSGYRSVQPGSIYGWAYNNYGFSVLGMTLELAAKEDMDDLLHRDLLDLMDIDAAFAPGDLEDSSKLVTLTYHGGSVARSVSTQRSLHSTDQPGASGSYFAGGFTISAADLGKLVALLANDGRYEGLQLMSEESVALMETVNSVQLAEGFYQGLPLRYQTEIYGRDRLYYHTGSAYGVYNCMSYDPDTGDGVVVLTIGASATKDDRGIYAICGEISHGIYDITKG